MKTYKNYMVVETTKNDIDWTIAVFNDFESAVTFCDSYIPRDAHFVEIQATDEDVDICVNIDLLYVRDVKTGVSTNIQVLAESDSRVKKIAMDEQLWDEGRTGSDGYIENLMALSTLSGCYDIIEYLLNTITEILND